MRKRLALFLLAAFTVAIVPVITEGCKTPSKTHKSGDDPTDKD